MWLLIDNYDSFSAILLDYLKTVHINTVLIQNDALSLEEIKALQPQRIILSPGPKEPSEAGITMEVIAYFYDKIPILGVCLGHQALGQFFGAALIRAPYPMHGKVSVIINTQKSIFENLPANFEVMRYHSLILDQVENTELEVLAHTNDGVIMAFKHKSYSIIGLQFHPESILTAYGLDLIINWKNLYTNN